MSTEDSTPIDEKDSTPIDVQVNNEEVEEDLSYPQPLQIIQTGDDESDYFILNQKKLNSIISKIPSDMKVSIISVVGAFRTGKSFLLNFFLRYLRFPQSSDDLSQAWMTHEGPKLAEGNMNETVAQEVATSFPWRGGQQRQTTGIWMWSEPFIREVNGEKLAILLMDTQGMFDNETTMTLTAQIFGLSTLISSFQIYNVEKRIQEDNLQHLALFSEYGRMALNPLIEEEKTEEGKGEGEETEKKEEKKENKEESKPVDEKKPFQKLLFLVRDWQNFDNDYEENGSDEEFNIVRDEMTKYLTEVLRARNQDDLQSTRDQISRCFEDLQCYLLPHPGRAVTKKNWDGEVESIDELFRVLINRFVRIVFDKEIQAKEINHRKITAGELMTYFEVYVNLFQAGQKTFPQAMTMLQATAEANNRNAYSLAINHYKKCMELVAGNDKEYVKEDELKSIHEGHKETSLKIFDEIATMGSPKDINSYKENLLKEIEEERERFFTTNGLKNPFKNFEFYFIPIVVALVSWVIAFIVDLTCGNDFCEAVEDTFVNIYLFIFFGIILLTWKQIKTGITYLKDIALPILIQGATAKNK